MYRNALCSTAIVTILGAGPVLADVTPEEVWDNWQAMSTSAGQEMTVGGSARNGDTLEVSDIVITHKDPMGGTASVSFDKLSFKDNGDGTVTVMMPESFPMAMAFPPEVAGENPGSMKLRVTQPGMTIKAGGSANETAYEFTAPTSVITLEELIDADGAPVDTKAELVMAESAGKYVVTREGESTTLDSALSVKAMSLNIEGKDEGGSGTASLSLVDVAMEMKGNVLSPDVMANMALALNSGFTMDMGISFGGLSMAVDAVSPSGPAKVKFDANGGGLDMVLNKELLDYGISFAQTQLVVSGPEIPFPEVQIGLGEFGFRIMGPVSKADAPQDFAYLTKLVDITTSEDVWAMFDPSGTLSRAPVTLVVDVNGTGFWNQDVMDPAVNLDTIEAPGELHTLNLTELRAKAAGADVSAEGGLTFDNTDRVTFGGVPKPAGKITVNILGVNALIDNLISMGLLPEDEAMGFRMGLAMFARPGAGPDELVSELEFRDGGLFANGQQIW